MTAPIDVDATARLSAAVRTDLGLLSYPDRRWAARSNLDDPNECNVVIVGGGQSGVIIAAGLAREGVDRVRVLDQAPAGGEGPWTTYARMPELRTPKALVGAEYGLPNLSIRAWHDAAFGPEAWHEFDRVPRATWRAYLDWYVDTLGITVENDATVHDICSTDDSTVTVVTNRDAIRASAVVLATGFDGAGSWSVPEVVAGSLSSDRYDHSNGPIDFDALAGARVGVLGHGASAFDNSIAALEAGATSVDLFFRRARLPRVNPHRFLETAGVMTHYPELGDATRWRIAHHFRTNDQPPPIRSFRHALSLSGFTLHPGSPWTSVDLASSSCDDQPEIVVTTPQGRFHFDHLITATGARTDLRARPELRSLAPLVTTWGERYQPPAGLVDDDLAAMPYLDDHYGFVPRTPRDAWVARVFAFNFASAVSHAPHSTSISGHKHAIPRVVRGITRRLLIDTEHTLLEELLTYRSDDLGVDDDFEAHHPKMPLSLRQEQTT